MGEGYADIQRGGGALVISGDGGRLMTHSADSVTTQNMAKIWQKYGIQICDNV